MKIKPFDSFLKAHHFVEVELWKLIDIRWIDAVQKVKVSYLNMSHMVPCLSANIIRFPHEGVVSV